MEKLHDRAASYGCSIDHNGQIITKTGKKSGLYVHIFNMRVKVQDKQRNNKLLFSAPYLQFGRFFEVCWKLERIQNAQI